MLPVKAREDFYIPTARMGFTLRRLMAGRLLGMAVEGVGTWLACLAAGIPMAALMGLLTGLLAFIPNIGAIVSGVLLVLVGFSAGTDTGLRSEEHTSELQSLMRISYAVFCLKKKKNKRRTDTVHSKIIRRR